MMDDIFPYPFVSVVVPTYNRVGFLDKCLSPLLAQSYPLDRYEIILVDDGSTDGTAEKAQALTLDWNGTFRVINKQNGGPASARNAGFRTSNAEIIAFIDSDCVAGPNWLEELIRALVRSNAVGIGGPVTGVDLDNWVSRYVEVTG